MVMVYNSFYMLLDSVCEEFFRIFHACSRKILVFSFLVNIFVSDIWLTAASRNELGSIPTKRTCESRLCISFFFSIC